MARIPNPDDVIQQLDLPYGPPPGLAWPYQENPLIAQIAEVPGMERSRLDRGDEPFPSKNVRPQSGQKALHQFRSSRTLVYSTTCGPAGTTFDTSA
ncbi:unnamed protein product [Prunus armeniaca]